MFRCLRRALLDICLLTLILTTLGAASASASAPAAAEQLTQQDVTIARELPEKRGQYSTTYLLSNGSFRSVLYQSPIHFKNEAGAWQSIDATLIPVSGIDAYTTVAAPVEVTLADEAPGQKPVTVESGGYAVTMNLLGWAEDQKLILGDSAFYADVAPDTDVTYTALGDGVKEVITLASADAPSTFTYRLTHAGLTLKQDDAGQWGLFAPGAEQPLFLIGAVNASDSSRDEADEPAWCDGAFMSVAPGENASTITYILPRAWLESPARVWPVRVDPNLGTRAPTDTYISAGYPSTAYGSDQSLFSGKVSTATGNCKSLVKFPAITNTNNIPAGAHISAATFSIRQFWQPASPTDRTHVYRVGSSSTNWGDATTWNSMTLSGSDEISPDSFSPSGSAWLNVGCTGITQDWVAGNPPNKGFCVRQLDADGASYARKFRSGEYSDVNYRPNMSVDWEQPTMTSTPDQLIYRVGDTAHVTAGVGSVADPAQITEIQMGINYADADASRRRSTMAWFKNAPTSDPNWVYQAAAANGGYFAWYDQTPGNSNHTTADLSSCTVNSAHTEATFVFKLNDTADVTASSATPWFGEFDAPLANDFDVKLFMSSSSASWTSGWLHKDTNVDVQPAAPQHVSVDLGNFAGHDAEATLDQGALSLGTTDLSVASWGPAATLARRYSSTNVTNGLYALGWRFNFERRLTSKSGGVPASSDLWIDYLDERGDSYVFVKASSTWIGPRGIAASLAWSGSSWALTFEGGEVHSFDSSGKLTRVTDRSGQYVAYGYGSGLVTSITAANGQAISLTYASGKLSSASYATASGTRTVSYSGGAQTWQVTYFPSQSIQRVVRYDYSASRLAALAQLDWPSTGASAAETFTYDASARLSEERFADYNATTKPDARAVVTYAASGASVTRYGRIKDVANTSVTSETFAWREVTPVLTARTLAPVKSGEQTTWSYGWAGNYELNSVSAPATGTSAVQSFDQFGNALHSTDASGHATTCTYSYPASDPMGQLASASGPEGTTAYSYAANGNLNAETKTLTASAEKTRTEYSYDSCGRLAYKKELISGTVNADGSVTGGVWAETDYDAGGYSLSGAPLTTIHKGVRLTDGGAPQDLSEVRTYDAFGDLLTETDTTGTRVTQSSTYDLAGRLSTSADALGATTHRLYDKLGNEIESWVSHTSSAVKADWKHSTYDALGRVLVESSYLHDGAAATLQSTVSYVYDGRGKEITTDDSTVGGQPAKTVYDERGNVIKEWQEGVPDYSLTRAARHLLADGATPAYDAADQATASTEPGTSVAATSSYDSDGKLYQETAADGSFTRYEYDDAGNVTKETTPLSGYSGNNSLIAETTQSFDLAGRQTQVHKPSGATTDFMYDKLDRQLSASGGGSPSTTVYNTLGWVLKATDADGVVMTNLYDAAGRLTSATKGTQSPTSSTYDEAGRVLTVTDPDGRLLTSTYDCFGNQTEERHTVGGSDVKHIDMTYDSLSRETSREDTLSGVRSTYAYPVNTEGGGSETLRYDSSSSVSTATIRNVRGQEAQRVATVTASPSNLTLTRTIDGRDDAERVTQATFAANAVSRATYDGAGRISKQWGAGTTVAASTPEASVSAAYSYDPDTGLKTVDNLALAYGGAIASTYAYNAAGRLNQATIGGVTATHTFDGAGNLTRVVEGGATTDFTYDAASRLTQTAGPQTTIYKWNASYGWRTSQGPTDLSQPITYGYTATGRLATYADSTRGVNASYSYDASGQRTRSVVTSGSTTTTMDYKYDGITLLELSATQGSSSWKIDYLYDEASTPYGGVYRSPASSTSPLAFGMVITDRGDVVELLDANGSPFAAYRYDAWGNPRSTVTQQTTLVTAALAADIGTRQVLRYASYCWDEESRLYYLSARSYDPATRQFVSKDPAEADGEESAYQYCGGEPVGTTDPTGAWAVKMAFEPPSSANLNGQEAFLDYVLQMNAGFAIHKMETAVKRATTSWGKALAEVRTWKWWAFGMVPNDHPWDLKRAAPESDRSVKYIPFHGSIISPEDFGNVLFGYTGRALGIPLVVLVNGSAGAYLKAYWSRIGFKNLWNEYKDEYWITRGARLTRQLKPVGRYNGGHWIQEGTGG